MEYVTLMGAEDVSRAGGRMAGAAEEMLRAANLMSESNDQQRRFMDDWLDRFRQTLEDHRDALVSKSLDPSGVVANRL